MAHCDELELRSPEVDLLRLAVMRSPAAWFELHGAVEAKDGAVLRPPDLKANYLQRQISQVKEWCAAHGVPCRLLILKPRQKGCSTFSVATLHCDLRNEKKRGAIIGGKHEQGANLFKILETYASHDDFQQRKATVLDRKARYPSGSRCVQLTAKDKDAGRSGTYQYVVATEVARWAEEGVANAAAILSGLLKCVPNLPGTTVILETTAAGASGDFYERWQSGITFEELKAGKEGFVKIFAPWFAFDDSRRAPRLEDIASEDDLTKDERDYVKLYSLSLDQVAWMRWAVREECGKDFDLFKQDYPFDAESAFLTSGRGRFLSLALKGLTAALPVHRPTFGVLQETPEGALLRPCPSDDAQVLRWEEPKDGCRYLVSVDPMTGETQTGSKDPDNHAVQVWRAGYHDARGGNRWVRPKVVARLIHDWALWEKHRRYVLTWDIDVLEKRVWLLARYFGNCLIVPEVNMDRGLIELLKLRGTANIFVRPLFNKREQVETKALGWHTDDRTREMAVECLARHVRNWDQPDDGVDIPCPILLSEMDSFVVKRNGRSEAAQQKHDDNVLAAAIGLCCIDGATVYRRPTVEGALPPDIAAAFNQRDLRSVAGAYT